jgi:hypothetical protein
MEEGGVFQDTCNAHQKITCKVKQDFDRVWLNNGIRHVAGRIRPTQYSNPLRSLDYARDCEREKQPERTEGGPST